MLFLDANDDVLVRRFEQGRRPHPLQGGGRILDGIAAERELLRELRDTADIVLDTSALNVHGLATAITELFSETGPVALRLNVMSFGFKYGLPVDANFVADARFIPNPHWVPQLRPHTGLDKDVSDYVLEAQGVSDFVERYVLALEPVLDGYRRENKHYATIAVGCTGGKHRSVAVAVELSTEAGAVSARHRDHHAPGPGPRVMALLTGPLPLVPPASAAFASQQDKGPSVVALGGGHGLSASLSALRLLTSELTAIVTVADDGGSSGRLREEYGVLPPGDLRMALSALCDDTDWGRTWRDVMQHRFAPGKGRGGSLDEHAMGNLLIVTLWELLGDTVAGLKWAGALLGARGEVLPMSSVPLTIEGEVRVTAPDGSIGAADHHAARPSAPWPAPWSTSGCCPRTRRPASRR